MKPIYISKYGDYTKLAQMSRQVSKALYNILFSPEAIEYSAKRSFDGIDLDVLKDFIKVSAGFEQPIEEKEEEIPFIHDCRSNIDYNVVIEIPPSNFYKLNFGQWLNNFKKFISKYIEELNLHDDYSIENVPDEERCMPYEYYEESGTIGFYNIFEEFYPDITEQDFLAPRIRNIITPHQYYFPSPVILNQDLPHLDSAVISKYKDAFGNYKGKAPRFWANINISPPAGLSYLQSGDVLEIRITTWAVGVPYQKYKVYLAFGAIDCEMEGIHSSGFSTSFYDSGSKGYYFEDYVYLGEISADSPRLNNRLLYVLPQLSCDSPLRERMGICCNLVDYLFIILTPRDDFFSGNADCFPYYCPQRNYIYNSAGDVFIRNHCIANLQELIDTCLNDSLKKIPMLLGSSMMNVIDYPIEQLNMILYNEISKCQSKIGLIFNAIPKIPFFTLPPNTSFLNDNPMKLGGDFFTNEVALALYSPTAKNYGMVLKGTEYDSYENPTKDTVTPLTPDTLQDDGYLIVKERTEYYPPIPTCDHVFDSNPEGYCRYCQGNTYIERHEIYKWVWRSPDYSKVIENYPDIIPPQEYEHYKLFLYSIQYPLIYSEDKSWYIPYDDFSSQCLVALLHTNYTPYNEREKTPLLSNCNFDNNSCKYAGYVNVFSHVFAVMIDFPFFQRIRAKTLTNSTMTGRIPFKDIYGTYPANFFGFNKPNFYNAGIQRYFKD